MDLYILRHASSLVPRVRAVYSAACIIPNSTQGARRPLRHTPAENNPAKDGSRHGYIKNKRKEAAVTHGKNWGESSAASAEEE